MARKIATSAVLGMIAFAALVDAQAGAIVGEVKFADDSPKLSSVKVSKDQDYCGETLPNETDLIDANGGLKNGVVFLDTAPASTGADPDKLNQVENKGCAYAPQVIAMRKGERLRIRNADPKLHIPHSYLRDKTVFMLSLPFENTACPSYRCQ